VPYLESERPADWTGMMCGASEFLSTLV